MVQDTTTATYPDYRDIFELRGHSYHQAMARFPDARTNEFLNVIAKADITPGMAVLDVPSGGAYLSRFLTDVELIGLETSQTFAGLAKQRAEKVVLFDQSLFPLRDGCVDRVLSIAGLHHVENKQPVFEEMRRVAAKDGLIVVADVAEGSFVRSFLDDFVGRYCVTGHSGWYFGETTRSELNRAGLEILEDEVLDYEWLASDLDSLAEFCRLLFGMFHADTLTVAQGIQEYLGTRQHEQQIGLNWQLRCFVCSDFS